MGTERYGKMTATAATLRDQPASVRGMVPPDRSGVYDPSCGEGLYILTPRPKDRPRINGPEVFGVRPGAPFHHTVPVSGCRPMDFEAEGLPEGLLLDGRTGCISGRIADPAHRGHAVTIRATNAHGTAEKPLLIAVGDTICLTPPLGWNSWNCWKNQVGQGHVLDSAAAMVAKGLRDHGWSYINIDDTWQGVRGGPFNAIQPDPARFPDMQGMCDAIHALGLKVGIYSTPWITTYAGHAGCSSDAPDGSWAQHLHAASDYRKTRAGWRVGSYTFEREDAAQWAAWGIDYLKYDWNPNDEGSILRMARALRECGRDIVYSISNSAPVELAALFMEEANCWRTAGDLKDRWDEEGPHLGIREQWRCHRGWLEAGGRGAPGHFPDADMLVVGDVVTRDNVDHPVPSRLTADEQYSHISLWVLWGCPLLIGCPIETMDEFTLGLLTNAEVLDVHQDRIAVAGRTVFEHDGIEVVVKELCGGAKAVGLFNLGEEERTVRLDWTTAGLEGEKTIRDLWRQADVGTFSAGFSARVRPHGVVLVRAG